MIMNKTAMVLCFALLAGVGGCSRQQSDWEKTRAANNTDSYEQFLKKYPNGEFTAQAQARVKELYEERDWQKARDADTQEAYQAFLKQYPEGKWTEEARIRVENFTLAQAPSNAAAGGTDAASSPGNTAAGDSRKSCRRGGRADSRTDAAGAHGGEYRARRLLCHPARGFQIEFRCRESAMGAIEQGISQAPFRIVTDRKSEEDRVRKPVPLAGDRSHRKACACDVRLPESQVAGLRRDPSVTTTVRGRRITSGVTILVRYASLHCIHRYLNLLTFIAGTRLAPG